MSSAQMSFWFTFQSNVPLTNERQYTFQSIVTLQMRCTIQGIVLLIRMLDALPTTNCTPYKLVSIHGTKNCHLTNELRFAVQSNVLLMIEFNLSPSTHCASYEWASIYRSRHPPPYIRAKFTVHGIVLLTNERQYTVQSIVTPQMRFDISFEALCLLRMSVDITFKSLSLYKWDSTYRSKHCAPYKRAWFFPIDALCLIRMSVDLPFKASSFLWKCLMFSQQRIVLLTNEHWFVEAKMVFFASELQ